MDSKEGVIARNSMHNRLVADAFISAGGRPNTIDKNNYHHFLMPDGKPSAPLIVEGANLFLTAEAQEALFEEAGVTIVKDSSPTREA
jgi:glutamate dehydrogenase